MMLQNIVRGIQILEFRDGKFCFNRPQIYKRHFRFTTLNTKNYLIQIFIIILLKIDCFQLQVLFKVTFAFYFGKNGDIFLELNTFQTRKMTISLTILDQVKVWVPLGISPTKQSVSQFFEPVFTDTIQLLYIFIIVGLYVLNIQV